MKICFTITDNYIKTAIVTIASIARYNKAQYYIIGEEFSQGSKDLAAEKLPDEDITFIEVGVDKYKLTGNAYYNSIVTLRLYLADIFPDLDKILFMDTDIIVQGSLQELWELDLSGYYLAAADEYFNHSLEGALRNYKHIAERANLHYLASGTDILTEGKVYFNGGVLLFNLREMRNSNFTSLAFNFINNFKPRLGDQSAINHIGYTTGKVKQFDTKYNQLVNIVSTQNNFLINPILKQKALQATGHYNLNDAIVLHYAVNAPWKQKPWNKMELNKIRYQDLCLFLGFNMYTLVEGSGFKYLLVKMTAGNKLIAQLLKTLKKVKS